MKDRQYKPRDKVVQKMTRDGLIEQNQTSGQKRRVSKRAQDISMRPAQPQDETEGRYYQRGASVTEEPAKRNSPRSRYVTDAKADNVETGRYEPGTKANGDVSERQEQHREVTGDSNSPKYKTDETPVHAAQPDNRKHSPVKPHLRHNPHVHDTPQQTATGPASMRPPLKDGQKAARRYAATEQEAVQQNKEPQEQQYTERDRLNFEATQQNDTVTRDSQNGGRLHFSPDEKPPDADRSHEKEAQKDRQQRNFRSDDTADAKKETCRLQFDKSELPVSDRQSGSETKVSEPDSSPGKQTGKRVLKAQNKLDKTYGKLEKARGNLPTHRRWTLAKKYDEPDGKLVRRLRFEEEVKPRGARNPVSRLGGMAAGGINMKVHNKLRSVEHENVGVEAAHKAEYTAERLASQSVRLLYRRVRDIPYRRVAKLERQATKANVNYLYRKAIDDNPELKKRLLSRFLQKQKIKRQYQKATREAKKGIKTAGRGVSFAVDALRGLMNFVGAHKGKIAVIAVIVLLVIALVSGLSSCAVMLTGGFTSVFIPSYKAEDVDIHDSDMYWTELEQDLHERIDNAESDHSGYDEYRYQIGEIAHDPFELIAFLSAMYDDFLYVDVAGVIADIFNEMYDLQFIPEVEIRYRRNSDDELESYEWHILNVVLEPKSFESVAGPIMESYEKRDMYDAYMSSYGGHQKYGNPLGFEWFNSITSLYGNRINPTGEGWETHRGLDIAAPIGTPLYAVQDGTVISAAWHDLFGWTIIVEDNKGRQTRFAHCNVLLASVGQKVKQGDKIAEVGDTGNSTGPHVHVEVKENGQYLNPLFLLSYTNQEDTA